MFLLDDSDYERKESKREVLEIYIHICETKQKYSIQVSNRFSRSRSSLATRSAITPSPSSISTESQLFTSHNKYRNSQLSSVLFRTTTLEIFLFIFLIS